MRRPVPAHTLGYPAGGTDLITPDRIVAVSVQLTFDEPAVPATSPDAAHMSGRRHIPSKAGQVRRT